MAFEIRSRIRGLIPSSFPVLEMTKNERTSATRSQDPRVLWKSFQLFLTSLLSANFRRKNYRRAVCVGASLAVRSVCYHIQLHRYL